MIDRNKARVEMLYEALPPQALEAVRKSGCHIHFTDGRNADGKGSIGWICADGKPGGVLIGNSVPFNRFCEYELAGDPGVRLLEGVGEESSERSKDIVVGRVLIHDAMRVISEHFGVDWRGWIRSRGKQ